MIITKKEFETITDKAIEKTFKEAQEKQKQLNVDMTAETAEVTEEKYASMVANNTKIAVKAVKNPFEKEVYVLLCVDNTKRVFDVIFGEKGNEWLKKECE